MSPKPKILFISHDSTLTGAPVLLFNLIGLLKEKGYEVSILLMRGGKMEDKFRELGKTFILKPAGYHKHSSFISRVFQYLDYRKNKRKILKELPGFDLVFNNTVTNGEILEFFRKTGKPVLTYVHELETVILQFQKQAELTFRHSSLFLCPSGAVSANLEKNHGIPASKIRSLPYFFPRHESPGPGKIDFFKRFDIPANRLYVAGMGTATKRKGFDLFVEICKKVVKTDVHFFFIWIGDFADQEMRNWFAGTLGDGSLDGYLKVTGELPHDLNNLSAWDVFLLTSREDPYPLVVIEAAQVGLPTVFFKGTGGIGDFVDQQTGWPLSAINIEDAVDLLLSLKDKKEEIVSKGNAAKKKAAEMHENREEIFRRCESIFDEFKKEY